MNRLRWIWFFPDSARIVTRPFLSHEIGPFLPDFRRGTHSQRVRCSLMVSSVHSRRLSRVPTTGTPASRARTRRLTGSDASQQAAARTVDGRRDTAVRPPPQVPVVGARARLPLVSRARYSWTAWAPPNLSSTSCSAHLQVRQKQSLSANHSTRQKQSLSANHSTTNTFQLTYLSCRQRCSFCVRLVHAAPPPLPRRRPCLHCRW